MSRSPFVIHACRGRKYVSSAGRKRSRMNLWRDVDPIELD